MRAFWLLRTRLMAFLLVIAAGILAPTVSHPRQRALIAAMRTCAVDQPPDIAISACTRLIDLNRFRGRELFNLLNARGLAYIKTGDFGRAIADYTEMHEILPEVALVYYLRGIAYDAYGDLKSALADFLEFRQLSPDNPDASGAVARTQQKLATEEQRVRDALGGGQAGIKVLQKRLTDEGCYEGSIDGEPSQTLTDAIKACPVQDPILRIETGTHVARARGIGADSQCRLLATTGDDKTIRIWSGANGHLLRTLRWPIDAANGNGNALAVSPDGRYIAAAGRDAHTAVNHQNFIYVFDTTTGALVARPFGFPDAMNGLAFSADGRWLAATGGNLSSGVRVYDTADWRLVMSDVAYQKQIYAVTFGPDGALYTAGQDLGLRRYSPGPSFTKEREVALKGNGTPFSIAADPRGEFVTVGFLGSRAAVAFFDQMTLRYRFGADTRNVDNGSLPSVAWSRDGERLLAGGDYDVHYQGSFQYPVFSFDRDGKRSDAPTSTTDDSIAGIRACGDDMAIISGAGFGRIDQAGTLHWHPSAAVDLRDELGEAFTIAPDARQVRFGLVHVPSTASTNFAATDPVIFDLSRGTLTGAPQPVPDFIAPVTTTLPVDSWREQKLIYAGRPILLQDNEVAHALAIRPDRDGFVIGAGFTLRAFEQDGSERWEVPSPTDVFGVNLSSDGRIVVAADGDGTIRWHRWSDGNELLALFVNKTDKRWVAWTPSGYYMASPGGEDLIGWHVNRGWNQTADFFPASRFREKFSRPDIVRLVLDTLDEDAAVMQANATAQRKEDNKPLINELPPVITIKGPAPGTIVATPDVRVDYAWRSPSGEPVDRISVLIDGRRVKEIGLPLRAPSQDAEVLGSLQIALRYRDNDVSLIAWSGDRSSVASNVKVVWSGAPAPAGASRKLFALVVGVSAYAQPDMALHYAAKDASDFAAALAAQKGGYYGEVQTRLVTDHEVTRTHLIQGLKWLSQVATSPDDVSVLFLAGHGLTDAKQSYWFLPSDASGDDYDATGVSQDEIRRYLQDLPGKVVWFLDTCHAGSAAKRPPVDMNLLVNKVTAAENGGIVAFASSRGREVSVENSTWKNGAFTKALIEGIGQGKADITLDGKITTSLLDFYLERRVQELTEGKQNPVMGRPPEEPDFVIAGASLR